MLDLLYTLVVDLDPGTREVIAGLARIGAGISLPGGLGERRPPGECVSETKGNLCSKQAG